ncbi:MAG: sodium:proton exchanger [Solirubrobacteraceae bacterium]
MARTSQLERVLLLGVLVAAGLAALARYAAWAAVPRFLLATLALIGLAWAVAFATEQLGGHLGAVFTGVIQATLANLPELFVILFALNAGELVVAQTAIVGSMLANALLLLGIVIVVGASRAKDGVMRFGRRLPNDTTTLLIVMLFAVVLCSPALGLQQPTGHERTISILSAACMLAVYGTWLYGYMRGEGRRQRRRAQELPAAQRPRLTLAASLGLLVLAGAGSAFVSEWFIDALRPATSALHIPLPFAGLVIVAIAGNAVEHAASVALAARGQAELAISVVKSSVGQIAGFLFPLVVIVSVALSTQLTLGLAPAYIGALALMTIVVWQVSGDGEATVFEGVALIALYAIVAIVAAFQ